MQMANAVTDKIRTQAMALASIFAGVGEFEIGNLVC